MARLGQARRGKAGYGMAGIYYSLFQRGSMSKKGQKFITNKKLIVELRQLYDQSNGTLTAEKIVEAARSSKTQLHKYFEWDNSKAAHQFRMEQARRLMQITVEYIETKDGNKLPVRVFASLTNDREDGGGYRSTVDIMSDKDMRKQLLTDALDELERIRLKYARIKELAEIFTAIAKARRRVT